MRNMGVLIKKQVWFKYAHIIGKRSTYTVLYRVKFHNFLTPYSWETANTDTAKLSASLQSRFSQSLEFWILRAFYPVGPCKLCRKTALQRMPRIMSIDSWSGDATAFRSEFFIVLTQALTCLTVVGNEWKSFLRYASAPSFLSLVLRLQRRSSPRSCFPFFFCTFSLSGPRTNMIKDSERPDISCAIPYQWTMLSQRREDKNAKSHLRPIRNQATLAVEDQPSEFEYQLRRYGY